MGARVRAAVKTSPTASMANGRHKIAETGSHCEYVKTVVRVDPHASCVLQLVAFFLLLKMTAEVSDPSSLLLVGRPFRHAQRLNISDERVQRIARRYVIDACIQQRATDLASFSKPRSHWLGGWDRQVSSASAGRCSRPPAIGRHRRPTSDMNRALYTLLLHAPSKYRGSSIRRASRSSDSHTDPTSSHNKKTPSQREPLLLFALTQRALPLPCSRTLGGLVSARSSG